MKIPLREKIMRPQGFTLMEVMVAVSIFTIIVTVGIAALLTINNSHKKSQMDRQAVDSLSYALEAMSRSLRTAQEWIDMNPDFIRYTDQEGEEVTYRIDNGVILKNDSLMGEHPVTPENIVIEDLEFTHYGQPTQQYLQINIIGTLTSGRQQSRFAVQTSVSKRILDTAILAP